jgi:hypothetical protein
MTALQAARVDPLGRVRHSASASRSVSLVAASSFSCRSNVGDECIDLLPMRH